MSLPCFSMKELGKWGNMSTNPARSMKALLLSKIIFASFKYIKFYCILVER